MLAQASKQRRVHRQDISTVRAHSRHPHTTSQGGKGVRVERLRPARIADCHLDHFFGISAVEAPRMARGGLLLPPVEPQPVRNRGAPPYPRDRRCPTDGVLPCADGSSFADDGHHSGLLTCMVCSRERWAVCVVLPGWASGRRPAKRKGCQPGWDDGPGTGRSAQENLFPPAGVAAPKRLPPLPCPWCRPAPVPATGLQTAPVCRLCVE
jgi:hypothetical protein